MTTTKNPTPNTEEELLAQIRAAMGQTEGGDMEASYEAAANALVTAATSSFNYAARALGVTGFQAGWAVLQIVADLNSIDGPFGIVKGEDMLYPQYDLRQKVLGWMDEWQDWAAEQALRKIEQHQDLDHPVNPRVYAHWVELVGEQPTSMHTVEEVRAAWETYMARIREEMDAQPPLGESVDG